MAKAWIQLELGIAESLASRPPNIDLLPRPRPSMRPGLVLKAAHTLLPELDVTTLPWVAAEEVSAGLTGNVRSQLAARAQPETEFVVDQDLLDLRDQLMHKIGSAPDRESALEIAARVHLARAVLGIVPLLVEVRCLFWYSAYVNQQWAVADIFRQASNLFGLWVRSEARRPDVESQMASLAYSVAGSEPTDLLDVTP